MKLTLSRQVRAHANDVRVDGINAKAVNLGRCFECRTSDLEVGHLVVMLLDEFRKGINDVDVPGVVFIDFLKAMGVNVKDEGGRSPDSGSLKVNIAK